MEIGLRRWNTCSIEVVDAENGRQYEAWIGIQLGVIKRSIDCPDEELRRLEIPSL